MGYVVRRHIDFLIILLIPTPLVLASSFLHQHPYFFPFFLCFFVLVYNYMYVVILPLKYILVLL